MPSQDKGVICILCKEGRVAEREEEVAFHQLTDKGHVFCRVNVRMGVCDGCGAKCTDDAADAIMDEAVRREYAKLP